MEMGENNLKNTDGQEASALRDEVCNKFLFLTYSLS